MIKKISLFSAFLFPSYAYSAPLPDEHMNFHISGARQPVIDIDTNLPEGFDVDIDVGRDGSTFMTSQDCVVKNGHIHAGPFTDNGADFLVGSYTISVMSAGAQFEPQGISKIIGEQGQYLNGPDVKDSDMGVGRVINTSRKFTIQ